MTTVTIIIVEVLAVDTVAIVAAAVTAPVVRKIVALIAVVKEDLEAKEGKGYSRTRSCINALSTYKALAHLMPSFIFSF